MRLRSHLGNFLDDACLDLRDADEGQIRRNLVWAVFALPTVATVALIIATTTNHAALSAAAMFPAAAIFAGAMTGTVSMLFGRVKDAVAAPRNEVGRDPVYQATVVFRTSLYCAQVALALNALLLVGVLVPVGAVSDIVAAVAVGVFLHLGMRVALLLQGLRSQALNIAGSRSQRPIPRRSAS